MEAAKRNMWMFLFVLCSCCIWHGVQITSQPTSNLPCFYSCVCEHSNLIVCTANRMFVLHIEEFNKYLVNRSLGVKQQVHIQTESTSVPKFLRDVPLLRHVSLAGNKLEVIQNGVLQGMRLQELNLSHNEVRVIRDEAFLDLHRLQVLDLSYNRLSSISKKLFSDLPSIKVLNLNFNRLLYFPFDAFSQMPGLEVLSLNHNQLSYLMPGSLVGLSSLRSLELRNNSLWSVTLVIREEVPSLESLDVSDNPFHCSCSIDGLRSIISNSSVHLFHSDHMLCVTPLGLRGQRVADVMAGLHECQKPLSVFSYDSQSILYMDDVQLSCDVQGDPDPAILWRTPWGHQFADPSDLPRLESVCSSCRHKRHYSSRAVNFESTVSVTQGGKRLRITNFRGFFNGNITCQAYNYLGNDTAIHQVEVISAIPTTFIDSLFMGAFSAGGFLCFGLFVGSIKLVIQACRGHFGKKRKVLRTPTTTILLSQEDASLIGGHSQYRDFSDPSNEDFDTPPSSPLAVSPLTSPPELITPNEGQGTPTGTWRATNILETMEEVSYRLRHGMGRKMKTVKRNVQSMKETGRRNVQSIRESGSMYMQNIRETGSTAASKVKAGVVMGMVTVKSHVQSIKEFCGTGDMGSHTISAISVETNLDTNETTEVVKSVTVV